MTNKNDNPAINGRKQSKVGDWVSLMGLLLWLLLLAPAHAQYACTTNSGKITITQYTGFGGAVTIPGTINGLPVTCIGDDAFSGCWLTSITIPNSVTNIGNSAFFYCTSLPSITIPNSVTSIGSSAFWYCSRLTSITLGNSVTNIGDFAFSACTSLTSITIPNGVTSIGSSAFWSCTRLARITIPNSVIKIGDSAFIDCWSLASITIPNSVTSIGKSAFEYCTRLTSITIPNSVTNIGEKACSGCTSLASVTLDNSVTAIAYSAFSGCTSLASVTIPNSVTIIGDGAFIGCWSLTSIIIPNSVTSIGIQAFRVCTSLRGIYFKGNAPSFDYDVFGGDTLATVYYLAGTKGWGSTFGDRPTAVWSLPMEISVTHFANQTNGFGFKVINTGTQPVVVDACASLANPIWIPLRTNTPSEGSFIFNDSQWTDHPVRFYRVRSQ